MSVNKVILIGRTGKDPEVRSITEDKKVANISLATTEKYKDEEKTEWHNLVIWNKLAEVAEKYIKKGDLLYIEGKISTRDWTDKDGNKRYTTEIVVNELRMLGGKKTDPAPEASKHYSPDKEQIQDDTPTAEDGLPF